MKDPLTGINKFPIIEWTPDKLMKFKAAYAGAIIGKHNSFEFQGNEYDTGYAKYLMEYLDDQFEK